MMGDGPKVGFPDVDNAETLDLYEGFEGTPELVFSYRTDSGARNLRMWAGHFEQLMEVIPESPHGWSGLALHYHLDSGWYDTPNWLIPNLDEAIDMLHDIAVENNSLNAIRHQLIAFLCVAAEARVPVTLNYF